MFLVSLTAMSAIAGWEAVFHGFRAQWSFFFAVAFASELVSFVSYIFAYRAVAAIEDGPQFSLSDAAALVAVGFGAFLAKGGAALDSVVFRKPDDSKATGEVRVLALDALEHAPLAPAACAASIDLLIEVSASPGSTSPSLGRRSSRSAPSPHSTAFATATDSSTVPAGGAGWGRFSKLFASCSGSRRNGAAIGWRSRARASTGLVMSPAFGRR